MSDRKSRVITPEEIQKQNDIIESIHRYMIQNNYEKKAFVETYGCQQNVSDSEVLCGMLEKMGYTMCDSREDADLIIYNTCAVREGAELKVFGNLGALKHLKNKNPDLIIGVCGCMMQQEQVQTYIKSKFKHVDMVFGPSLHVQFPKMLSKVLQSRE